MRCCCAPAPPPGYGGCFQRGLVIIDTHLGCEGFWPGLRRKHCETDTLHDLVVVRVSYRLVTDNTNTVVSMPVFAVISTLIYRIALLKAIHESVVIIVVTIVIARGRRAVDGEGGITNAGLESCRYLLLRPLLC